MASWWWRKRNPTPAMAGIESRTFRSGAPCESKAGSRSGGCRLAALDLGAVARGKQQEGLRIARLGRLSGAGMRPFGAVVLRRRVDAVAFLELALLHSRHVVLHHLRHLAHVHLALRLAGRRLDRQGESHRG